MGPLIKYAMDNFREGKSLRFNRINDKKKESENSNYQVFDAFLKERHISDPYKQYQSSAVLKPVYTKTVNSILIHEPHLNPAYSTFSSKQHNLFSESTNSAQDNKQQHDKQHSESTTTNTSSQ